MIGASRQAFVYLNQNRNPILPRARFGKGQTVGTAMLENLITAFIVYFVVIDPAGSAIVAWLISCFPCGVVRLLPRVTDSS